MGNRSDLDPHACAKPSAEYIARERNDELRRAILESKGLEDSERGRCVVNHAKIEHERYVDWMASMGLTPEGDPLNPTPAARRSLPARPTARRHTQGPR